MNAPTHRPPYMTAALRIRHLIQQTMNEAQSLLPPAVTRHHYITRKHSPSAWRSVEAWFRTQEDDVHKARVLHLLTDLALMSEALACFKSLTAEEVPKAPPDLSLKKTRHVES